MNNRHAQWPEIIAAVQPATIIEIGTHRGRTAEILVREALKYAHHVEYTGYDLFEPMANRSTLDMLLGRRSSPKIKFAEARLAPFGRWLTFSLISGSTTETLHKDPQRADLVFIDGGYSAAIIAADLEAVSGSRTVILNNYFEPMAEHMPLPESFEYLGCNFAADRGKLLPGVDDVPELGIRARFLGIGLPEGVV